MMARSKAQPVLQTDDDTLYYERCAGIDVHKKLLVVCLRIVKCPLCQDTKSKKHNEPDISSKDLYVNDTATMDSTDLCREFR